MGLSQRRVKPKTINGIACFYAKRAALRKKSKDWLAFNQDNVSLVERHVFLPTVVSVN
jgi:hypothetical protein